MKYFPLHLVAGLVFLIISICTGAPSEWTATVTLVDGKVLTGTVQRADSQSLFLKQVVGAGTVTQTIPAVRMKNVEFAFDARIGPLLNNPTAKDLPALASVWAMVAPVAMLSEGNARLVGVAYAKALLAEGSEKSRERSAAILELLGSYKNKTPALTVALIELRISAALARQQPEEANSLLASVAMDRELAPKLEGLRVRVGRLDSVAAIAALDQLEKDWPKWHLMPEVAAERQALVDRAVFGYLRAPVLQPGKSDAAAQGLLDAAVVFKRIGRIADSAARAQDAVEFYPAAAAFPAARKLLAELREHPDFPEPIKSSSEESLKK